MRRLIREKWVHTRRLHALPLARRWQAGEAEAVHAAQHRRIMEAAMILSPTTRAAVRQAHKRTVVMQLACPCYALLRPHGHKPGMRTIHNGEDHAYANATTV